MRKLESIRVDLGLTQEEMAKKIGLKPFTYQKKEQGKSPLLAKELRAISKLSNVPEAEIELPC